MGTLLIILGIIGLILSTYMFGDIGLAGGIGSLTALLSGMAINSLNKKVKQLINKVKKAENQ